MISILEEYRRTDWNKLQATLSSENLLNANVLNPLFMIQHLQDEMIFIAYLELKTIYAHSTNNRIHCLISQATGKNAGTIQQIIRRRFKKDSKFLAENS